MEKLLSIHTHRHTNRHRHTNTQTHLINTHAHTHTRKHTLDGLAAGNEHQYEVGEGEKLLLLHTHTHKHTHARTHARTHLDGKDMLKRRVEKSLKAMLSVKCCLV